MPRGEQGKVRKIRPVYVRDVCWPELVDGFRHVLPAIYFVKERPRINPRQMRPFECDDVINTACVSIVFSRGGSLPPSSSSVLEQSLGCYGEFRLAGGCPVRRRRAALSFCSLQSRRPDGRERRL